MSDARLEAEYDAIYLEGAKDGEAAGSWPRDAPYHDRSPNGVFTDAPPASSDHHTRTLVGGGEGDTDVTGSSSQGAPKYRDTLPIPMFSRDEFSIWHILRQCIGKVGLVRSRLCNCV